jgi:hypothetical protein
MCGCLDYIGLGRGGNVFPEELLAEFTQVEIKERIKGS